MIEREFPYANLHDLNINWILKIVKDFNDKYTDAEEFFAEQIRRINEAGQAAVDAIHADSSDSLDAIETFKNQCISAITSLKDTTLLDVASAGATQIANIRDVTNNQLSAINTAGSNQQNYILSAGTQEIAEVRAEGDVQISRLQSIVNQIPANYQDALNQLEIINSILNSNPTYPSLVSGDYDMLQNVPTLSPSDYIVSTVPTAGAAGRKLHVTVTNGNVVIARVKYRNWWTDGQSITSRTINASEYEFTFPMDCTYFSITFEGNNGQQITPSDFEVTLEWIVTLFDDIESEIDSLASVVYGTPKQELFTLTSGKRYNLASGNNPINGTPTLQTGTGKYVIFDLGIAKNNGKVTIHVDEITNNSSVGCLISDSNNKIIKRFVSSGSNGFTYDSTLNKYVYSTSTGTGVNFHFSIYGGSSSITVYLESPQINPDLVYINESTGNDSNLGTSSNPIKTLNQALKMKAKEAILQTDLHQSIEVSRDIIISGAGHVIYGDIELTTESYNSILKAEYDADTRITNCFVSQTTALIENVSGSSWKGPKYNICCFTDDAKLLPVSDVATCESTPNSFTWYDGYFYINATGTRFAYVTKTHVISITHGKLTLNDVKIKHSTSDCIDGSSCILEMNGCTICGSVNQNCVTIENGTLIARNCEVYFSWNDGINTHGRGDSTIINCYCHDCSDDGISQHDNTTGVIIGGEFCRCGKGGISSPINSAIIDIYNAYVHDNNSENSDASGYGIYSSSSGAPAVTFRIFGCVISNNKVGIRIATNNALVYGSYLYGNTRNTHADSGGTITFLG